ncbi:unnamed protein product [Schistosoma margrebowiei]|uniref:Uncharacterized protein n=1 Tax=Schistosoma margrebowiei TaxID=48269 RepID=A0A183M166_9TREM|nr:unnamed protein product [Schistosoma margrebowiei]
MSNVENNNNNSNNNNNDNNGNNNSINNDNNCNDNNLNQFIIEDRRIRAEQIVIKQGEQINELKLRLRQTETDAQRKLTESIQKIETRYRDRDTNFIDELVAERERLTNENTKLSYQVQHLEELQLDQERGALKISKAFNLEGNSQGGVISNLE